MTHKEIYDLLNTLNIPISYNHFEKELGIIPPFIVYRETSPETFKADNKVYFKEYSFQIELVTIKKDIILENQIEELLNNNNIPYEKSDEVWDSKQKIYHNFYDI